MSVWDVLQGFVAVPVCLFMTYLASLSVAALLAGQRKEFPRAGKRRFAFLVPAHNEESGIGRTIDSLRNVEYPPGAFDVVVIADNCTDQTAERAHDHGARVMIRTDPVHKSKGYALRWCLDKMLGGEHPCDAFVVVDADSVVMPNILMVMDMYLDEGAEVVQVSDVVRPAPGAWSSEVTRLAFALFNVVRPLGKKTLGCSAGLRGNGMCFTADILRRVPWSAHSLAEDLEFGLILQLNGTQVVFAPEAQVVATMPKDPRNAQSQRERWEMGRFRLLRRYVPLLLGAALRTRSLRMLESAVDLVTPGFVNMTGLAVAGVLVNATVAVFAGHSVPPALIVWGLVLLMAVTHVGVGMRVVHADDDLLKTILYFPRYITWKMALYARMIGKGIAKDWVRTTRE